MKLGLLVPIQQVFNHRIVVNLLWEFLETIVDEKRAVLQDLVHHAELFILLPFLFVSSLLIA